MKIMSYNVKGLGMKGEKEGNKAVDSKRRGRYLMYSGIQDEKIRFASVRVNIRGQRGGMEGG